MLGTLFIYEEKYAWKGRNSDNQTVTCIDRPAHITVHIIFYTSLFFRNTL